MMKYLPLLFILFIVGAIGCDSDDEASPEDTVRGFLDMVQDGNPEKMTSYLSEDLAEESLEDVMRAIKGREYSNITTELLYQGEYDAVVHSSFNYQIFAKDDGP